VATTITVEDETRERLADYKYGDLTYDDVLNMLMDKVPIEDVSAEHIREHYRRLGSFRGLSKDEFRKRVQKGIARGS